MNIKDYLHLYLGCRVILKFDLENFKGSKYDEGNWFLDSDLLDSFYNDKSMSIKPILRPLSDMTAEEFRWLEEKTMFHPGGFDCTDDVTQEWKNEMKEEIMEHSTPEIFHYILSKHFDLFGLIEAGLAVNAAELKTVTE